MSAMPVRKFERSNECQFLRVTIASDVQERLERYHAFCGTHEHTSLVEHVLEYMVDEDANCRAREKDGTAAPVKDEEWWCVERVSPADKAGGAP
jgi:hypothetical protein